MFDLISAVLVLKISIFRSTINLLSWALDEPYVDYEESPIFSQG